MAAVQLCLVVVCNGSTVNASCMLLYLGHYWICLFVQLVMLVLDVSMYGSAPLVVEFQGYRRHPRHQVETLRRLPIHTQNYTPAQRSLTSRLDRRSVATSTQSGGQ